MLGCRWLCIDGSVGVVDCVELSRMYEYVMSKSERSSWLFRNQVDCNLSRSYYRL